MSKSVIGMVCTVIAAVGAQIALVPTWSEATSPHFVGSVFVTVGAAVAGWIFKSPIQPANQ